MTRYLALLFLLLSSTLAMAASPPSGAKLYVVWGSSEASGHDNPNNSPLTVTHGNNIWAMSGVAPLNGTPSFSLVQNPWPHTWPVQEPAVNNSGASPNGYFADEMIKLGKATNVILLHCPHAGAGWTGGIRNQILGTPECIREVQYVVSTYGAVLSGGLSFCCAGDTLSLMLARAFPMRFKQWMTGFRGGVGSPALPIIAATTPWATDCRTKPYAEAILEIRKWQMTKSQLPHVVWVQTRPSNFHCYHLSGPEQEVLGRSMARVFP